MEDIEKPVDAGVAENSVALKRLIDEVKSNQQKPTGNYNRTYHRHNR